MNEPLPREPNGDYLDRLMRRESFSALWPLFAKATKPAKELTESFAALEHLRPLMTGSAPCRVIHIGDGAHARTAALFAIKTKAENISVDPVMNVELVEAWQAEYGIFGMSIHKSTVEDLFDHLNALPKMRVLLTFVHAHVGVDRILDRLKWDAAFTLACCQPGKQLSRRRPVYSSGQDFSVLSGEREYQVLVNE
jgi:hypothetical protein